MFLRKMCLQFRFGSALFKANDMFHFIYVLTIIGLDMETDTEQ